MTYQPFGEQAILNSSNISEYSNIQSNTSLIEYGGNATFLKFIYSKEDMNEIYQYMPRNWHILTALLVCIVMLSFCCCISYEVCCCLLKRKCRCKKNRRKKREVSSKKDQKIELKEIGQKSQV